MTKGKYIYSVKNTDIDFAVLYEYAQENEKRIYAFFSPDGVVFAFYDKKKKISIKNGFSGKSLYYDSRFIAKLLNEKHGFLLQRFFPKEIADCLGFAYIEVGYMMKHIANMTRIWQEKASLAADNFLNTDVPSEKKKEGYVYFIYDESKRRVKIGKAVEPYKRLGELKTGNPELDLVYAIKTDDYSKLEENIHKVFAKKRIVREWFDLSFEKIKSIFPKAQSRFDVNTSDSVNDLDLKNIRGE